MIDNPSFLSDHANESSICELHGAIEKVDFRPLLTICRHPDDPVVSAFLELPTWHQNYCAQIVVDHPLTMGPLPQPSLSPMAPNAGS